MSSATERVSAILLNGPSSSGKTTLATAFQKEMSEPTLYVSNEKFIRMAPDKFLADPQMRPRLMGPLVSAFNRSLPIIAECGYPMIIEHVLEQQQWLDELAATLEGYLVYLVKIYCPLDELERREKARGDRIIGLTKSHHILVHSFCEYDAEINTSQAKVAESAAYLKKLFYSGRKPTALEHYRREMRGRDATPALL